MKKFFIHQRGVQICVFAVVAAIALVVSCNDHPPKNLADFRVDRLCDYGAEIFAYPEDGIGLNPSAQDALRLCPRILSTLRWGEGSQWTEELLAPIHMLMDQFYEYGYFPREPYEGVGDYVTAMDAPLLAVTAELAYERGCGDQYRQYMEDLIPYIVSDTTQNGFVLKMSDTEWWPLEYAWTTVSEEDAWFVLNGSLYGMVYIEMLKNLTGDELLIELSEKTFNAYKSKMDEFLYPDGSWCYYSLNYLDHQKIINPIRKVAIEINALDALYLLTGESFYQEQLEIRNDLMAAVLPVYIVKDGDTNTAMLLRGCAPHPYMIETYESILEFLDADGNVVATAEEESNAVRGTYIMTEVPDGITSYRLYRYHKTYHGQPANKRLWVEAPVKYMDKADLETEPAAGSWSCALDAVFLENGRLCLDPDASENLYGHINYTLEEAAEYSPETYWIVEINNLSDESFPMRTFMYDQNGVTMGRTLLPLQPGKNLLFYSPLGFKEHEWPLDKFNLLNLVVVTQDLEEPAELELGNVYVFHRTADVVAYLSQYEFTDFWTIKE